MAKKFFNQKVKKKAKLPIKSIVIIVICVILTGIAVMIIINSSKGSKTPNNAKVEVGKSLTVEINNKNIDKTLFFTELENVKESDINVSYNNVDFSKVGEYDVTLQVLGKTYNSKLIIVDTESPVLDLKDVTISAGGTYKAQDFVKNCTDNSEKDCIVDFYKLSVDQDGNKIDYSTYTLEGTYTILLVAKDEAGNESAPVSTSLTIGKKTQTKPINCKYGTSEYDTEQYLLSVDITENGCALDLNLYQSEETLKSAYAMIKNDEEKIKNEYKALNTGEDAKYNSSIDTILNTSGNGIVGQSILIEVVVTKNNQDEIIASYRLNKEGKRVYTINKYNFK